MDTYCEHIRSKIKGMISSSFIDVFEFELDFNSFVEYLEKIYDISESNFEYHVSYGDKIDVQKDYCHYVTLDNSLYLDIRTFEESDIKEDIVINMDNAKVQNIIAYSSQTNNKKLIKFMNDVNSFVIKNKKEKNNV